MNFDRFLDNKILLNFYGRYFWYLEIGRATEIIGAYLGDELAGVLLAEMKGQDKKYKSFCESLSVKVFNFLQNTFYKDGVAFYDEARGFERSFEKSVELNIENEKIPTKCFLYSKVLG